MENEKLVKFLYLLARDHVPAGKLHATMAWVNDSKVDHSHTRYSCQYTEGLARELASELMELDGGRCWLYLTEGEPMKPLNYEGDEFE